MKKFITGLFILLFPFIIGLSGCAVLGNALFDSQSSQKNEKTNDEKNNSAKSKYLICIYYEEKGSKKSEYKIISVRASSEFEAKDMAAREFRWTKSDAIITRITSTKVS